MRWERLFDDLEAQAAAADARDLADEVGERTRIEQGRLPLVDRLRGARGTGVVFGCGGQRVSGTVLRVAADALVLEDAAGGQLLVPVGAIDWVSGLGRTVIPPDAGRVTAGFGLRALLREVVRDRAAVRVRLRDGGSVAGTLDAVGQDWLEIAEHPPDEPRRARSVGGVRVVPLPAVVTIRLV